MASHERSVHYVPLLAFVCLLSGLAPGPVLSMTYCLAMTLSNRADRSQIRMPETVHRRLQVCAYRKVRLANTEHVQESGHITHRKPERLASSSLRRAHPSDLRIFCWSYLSEAPLPLSLLQRGTSLHHTNLWGAHKPPLKHHTKIIQLSSQMRTVRICRFKFASR